MVPYEHNTLESTVPFFTVRYVVYKKKEMIEIRRDSILLVQYDKKNCVRNHYLPFYYSLYNYYLTIVLHMTLSFDPTSGT